MDDENKKILKEIVEQAIDRKLDDRDRKSAEKTRLKELEDEKKNKQDREDLLKELTTRVNKGEATLGQKWELLKLKAGNLVSDDTREAWDETRQIVGGGAKQLGKGLGHLTKRAMMSNPLTAFLYANRDLLGAGFDVLGGAAKMGWGAVKGVGMGALGLVNSAVNMFQKNKIEDEVEEQEERPSFNLFGGNNESSGETILQEKDKWKQQIDEIHKKLITSDKQNANEQKKTTSILAKGLNGLNTSMKAVSGFVDTIVAKQKIILGAILLGVVGFLALKKWFEGGGLAKLLQKPIDDSFNKFDDTQTKRFDIAGHASALSNMSGSNQQALFSKDPSFLSGVADTKTSLQDTGELNNQGKPIMQGVMDVKVGELTPVLAPYDGSIGWLKQLSTIKNGEIEKVTYVMQLIPNNRSLAYLEAHNIINPQYTRGYKFKEGEILAYATDSFQWKVVQNTADHEKALKTLDNYKNMVNAAKENNFKDQLDTLAKNKDEKRTQKTKDAVIKMMRQSDKSLGGEGENIARGTFNVKDFFTKKNEEEGYQKAETALLENSNEFLENYIERNNTNSPSVTSTNIEKAEQQNKQLNEQKKPEENNAKTSQNDNNGDKVAYLPSSQTDITQIQYSDIMLNLALVNAMTNNNTDLSQLGQ